MSSNDGVFLYIGIVAIWAGFLIPAWIRRPHGSQADLSEDLDESADAADWAEAEWTTEAEWTVSPEDAWTDESAWAAGAAWTDEAEAREVDSDLASRPQYGEHVPDYAEAEHRPDADPVVRRSRDAARSPHAARVPMPRTPAAHTSAARPAQRPPASPPASSSPPAHPSAARSAQRPLTPSSPATYPSAGHSSAAQSSAARPAQPQRPPAPSPSSSQQPSAARPPSRAATLSQSRLQMLRARRRMLTILLTLSLITGGFVVLGLVQWWICMPPIAMLALYVLLLREIAMADAQLAAKRAAWEARAAARTLAAREAQEAEAHAERVATQRRREAWAAAEMAAEPDAEIIDISSRVGDQLYDQYADAAVRAVGD